MQSRMEKYFESEDDNQIVTPRSRTRKNQELYKEVSNLELEDFDLNNNMSVIGDNSSNINLDDIKDILDKKYHEPPKNKSFGNTEETSTHLDLNETREYDINSILEKAKEQKEVNYEEDRLKKIRNTQYDILKSLDIINNDDEEIEEKAPIKPSNEVIRKKETKAESEQRLKELIDTITAKELIKEEASMDIEGDLDPLDLLSDLKGDDENTRVMGMLAEELKEAEKENSIALQTSKKHKLENTLGIENEELEEVDEESSDENEDLDEEDIKSEEEQAEEQLRKTMAIKEFDKELEAEMQRREEEDQQKQERKKAKEKESGHTKDLSLTNTFTTNTLSFTQSDFDDFIDLKEDMQITKVIVKILIIIIIIAFIIAIIVLANNYLQLGLF